MVNRHGFSHLHDHKFKSNSQDTLNAFCTYGCFNENTCHFLLHCPNFLVERNALLNKITTIDTNIRSGHPEVFLEEVVLKMCSKFTGEHPCWSVISIKLLCNFFEIALRRGCSPINLLLFFRTPFPKNTSEELLLNIYDNLHL